MPYNHKYSKHCLVCGKEFETCKRTTLYCGSTCWRRASRSCSKKAEQKLKNNSSSGKERGTIKSRENKTLKAVVIDRHFDSTIYSVLPLLLRECTSFFKEKTEKDMFLLGSISVLSACLPNVEGYYFGETVSPHLYTIITAPAGAGKGKLKWTKYFGQKIHDSFVKTSKEEFLQYEKAMETYKNMTRVQRREFEKPIVPKKKMFYVPANCSSSGFIQALSDNFFKALIFETEIDTLADKLRKEWGDFSDVLRKAFHHESTTLFRRTNCEYIEVLDPHLSILLSGTPDQVRKLISNVENGLFSRFLYYYFENQSEFKSPFDAQNEKSFEKYFTHQSHRIFDLYNVLKKREAPVLFSFSSKQQAVFTEYFSALDKRNRVLVGDDFIANSRRLGLICFRIAMIFSSLRFLETDSIPSEIVCRDDDFSSVLRLCETLDAHSVHVFVNLLGNGKKSDLHYLVYCSLPQKFDFETFVSHLYGFGVAKEKAVKFLNYYQKNGLVKKSGQRYEKS